MRRIKSAADVERTRRRNNIILGVVMIGLLTLSSLGYSLMSADSKRSNSVSENGFDFVRDGGMWKMRVEDRVFGFQNLPSEALDVDVNISGNLGMYNGNPVYFVNPGEGSGEILRNIGDYILRYQEACLNGSDVKCEGNLPVKDCSFNLIIFESGNESRVYGRDNCVFIVGDVLKGSDAFLYKILGVN